MLEPELVQPRNGWGGQLNCPGSMMHALRMEEGGEASSPPWGALNTKPPRLAGGRGCFAKQMRLVLDDDSRPQLYGGGDG